MKPYVGSKARSYEAKRRKQATWQPEHNFVAEQIQGAASVLDCPVGTGRFLPIYRDAGIDVLGVDVSEDMLAEARRHEYGRLEVGSVFDLGDELPVRDVAVCVRFLNWLDIETVEQTLGILSARAREVLASVRLSSGHPRKTLGNTLVHDEEAWKQVLSRLGLVAAVDQVVHRARFGDYHLVRLGSAGVV